MRTKATTVFLIMCSLAITCVIAAPVNSGVSAPALRDYNPVAPAFRNQIGSGTVPPTTYRSGLHRSPNPIDNTGNLIVTGNIGGGRHFRGVVPYNAVSDFGGQIGSGTLDEFVRYSSISSDFYRGGTIPFYSQTSTVTRTVPGSNAVIVPPSRKVRSGAFDTFSQFTTPLGRAESTVREIDTDTDLDTLRYLPVSADPLEDIDASEKERRPELSPEEYQAQLDRFKTQLKLAGEQAEGLKQQLERDSDSPLTERPVEQKDERPDSQDVSTVTGSPKYLQHLDREDLPVDVYEKMMQQVRHFEQSGELPAEQPQDEEEETAEKSPFDIPDISERRLEYAKPGRITSSSSSKPAARQRPRRSDADVEAEARVVAEHKTFASYAEDRFNRNLRAAEQYMKQGKFYLAADAYSVAAVYKLQDPLVYAGKSHALFAAGEYISSAMYMAKVLQMFPAYTDFRVDIVTMIGDLDTVEKRLADLSERADNSSSGELQLLLAYVYMQLDRLDKAQDAADTAYERMSDLPAAAALKQAIEKRRGR